MVLFVKSSRSQGPRGCVECAEYNKVSLLSLDHTAYETCDELAGCFGPVRCSGSLFSAVVARPRPTMMSGRSVPDPARGFPPLSHTRANHRRRAWDSACYSGVLTGVVKLQLAKDQLTTRLFSSCRYTWNCSSPLSLWPPSDSSSSESTICSPFVPSLSLHSTSSPVP